MTPHRGNTILFRSSQHLPRLRLGSLKGTVSAQKTLQGSETETRELLEEQKRIVLPRQGVIDLPYRQIKDFLPFWPP